MTGIDDFIGHAKERAALYAGCSVDQALVYSCEDVADAEYPSRRLHGSNLHAFVASVCDVEGMEMPLVVVRPSRSRTEASTDVATGLLCLHRRSTNTATVLHELAHHGAAADHHGVVFRDEVIRLIRRHVGVEHASFLYSLMRGCGLELSPWPASAKR